MREVSPDIGILYGAFSEKLREFIRARVPDESTAEDILHDVFLKVHGRVDTLRDQDKVESWLYRITRNAIIDHYRAKKESVEPDETIAVEEEVEDKKKELAPSLREMIENLPEQYREAIRLTEYEGLTQKELAGRLGISLSGAKSRVQRARAMLRDMLMECCHFEFDRFGTVIDYHPISCCCDQAQSSRV